MKIVHQKEKCVGCGACASICPDFFEINLEDNLAQLKNSKKNINDFELEVENTGCVKNAALMCPVKAIKIED
ncbi:MAG: ferredoxin [Patescibacteria group bacterium]|nr:ferredoxin [Patescibacteria group bacterium]